MPIQIDAFEACDDRGQIPAQINSDICYQAANATAEFLDAGSGVAVGALQRVHFSPAA